MRVTFTGTLAKGVTPKDMILSLLSQYSAAGGKGHAVEFAGEAVTALDMEGRMTLCNMATEFSAMSGFIAPDEKTFEYLKGRRYAPTGGDWDKALQSWLTLNSDAGAHFDQEIEIDTSSIAPMVSWGTNPGQTIGIDGT
ncbi:aconitase family protein, partial [Parasphingorhabdus sp. JC815]|uniref:aconitase family protein n=1 Tax=Parasphingorhabdus sp. JC815 TaxID=3232140 RepID=UPI00345AB74D